MNEKEKYIELYKKMKKIRMTEEAIAEEYPNREMHTPIHLYTGEEAIAAGFCVHLNTEDTVVSNHRSHGHYIAKGGNLKTMIAELYNKSTGCSKGRGGSMHLIDLDVNFSLSSSIVAGGVPIGTGNALASHIRKDKCVTVVFLGDAATEEGCVYESICFAKLLDLPVIFVCENNLYSICTPLDKREPTKNVIQKFEGILATKIINGNDVLEVEKTAEAAIQKAREGGGPSFIECKTYRLKDHHNIGTGVELGYRTQEEWDKWNDNSPIVFLEKILFEKNILNNIKKTNIEAEITAEIKNAFEFAKNSELPDEKDILNYVYCEEGSKCRGQ